MGRISLQVALGACFALIAAIAVAAVDYSAQARRAGASLGTYGVGSYVLSISDRFLGMKAAQKVEREKRALQALAVRELLPEAPEGWTRRDWTEADRAALDPQYNLAEDQAIPAELKQDPVLGALLAVSEAAADAGDARTTYVYEKDGEVVALKLQHTPSRPGGMQGMAMAIVAGNLNAMTGGEPFAVAGGVAFQQSLGLFAALTGEADAASEVTLLVGRISDEASITLRGKASEASMIALLRAIDYDRINGMLDNPVPTVGNAAPMLDPEASRARAAQMLAAQDAEIQARGRRAESTLIELGQMLAGEGADQQRILAARELYRSLLAGVGSDGQKAAAGAEIERLTGLTPADLGEAGEPQADTAQDGGGLFANIFGGSDGGVDTAEVEAPKVFSCSFDRGFKRCAAAD